MIPLGVYIHIPFCVRKCYYCDFCSSAHSEEVKLRYVDALKKEISSPTARKYFSNHRIESIFFGGGTPTCIPSECLVDLLETVDRYYSVSDDTEITTECNPGTVMYEDLLTLRHGGFNRLSIGLQSVNDRELKSLGRIHSFNDFDKTFNNARMAGFSNISLDLMYGIPLQNETSFDKTLERVMDYSPEHVSAYALKIEPGTQFFKNREKLILPDEDSEYNMYMSAVSTLKDAGYRHYEISNYARCGYESRHNLKYWNCDDYVGFGVSAHSCIGTKRYFVTSSIKEYLECIDRNDSGYVFLEEELSLSDFAEEYVMMRMRLADGLSTVDYKNRFGIGFEEKYSDRIMPYIKSGHIIYSRDNGKLRFSDESMYVSNYILSDILDLRG